MVELTTLRSTQLLGGLLYLISHCVYGANAGAPETPEEMPAGPAPRVLEQQLQQIQAAHNIPVTAVRVWIDGKPILNSVTGADIATPMRWGSITKTFTALTVLALVDKQRVALHAPLATFVDANQWHNPWRPHHPVQVIHLLELTAGFTDLSGEEFNYKQPLSLKQALALNPAHRTTRWPPGLQHSYTNLAPGLTQLLIETTTGQAFGPAVASLALKPLGMHHTSFAPRPDLPGGFKADGVTPIPYWHMVFPAFGAMNAPIGDIGRMVSALLNNGVLDNERVLSENTLKRLFAPASSASVEAGFRFSYASGIYPRVRRGFPWWTHGGDADGYRSRYAMLRDHKRAYAVAINTDNPEALRKIESALEAYLVRDLQTPKPPPAIATNAGQWTGRYYPSSARFGVSRWQTGNLAIAHLTATEKPGELVFQRGTTSRTLIPVTQGTYRRNNDPVATIAFVRDIYGHLLMQGELGNYIRIGKCAPEQHYPVVPLRDSCSSDTRYTGIRQPPQPGT